MAPQSAAELELLHSLLPAEEYLALAEALGASPAPAPAQVPSRSWQLQGACSAASCVFLEPRHESKFA